MDNGAMNERIRRAALEDITVIRALCAVMDASHVAGLPELFRHCDGAMRPVEFWEAALHDERDVLLVSESRAGTVVAYALLTIHDTPDIPNVVPRRLGILEDLVVHPDHRRLGHAKRLLERVDREARAQGAAS